MLRYIVAFFHFPSTSFHIMVPFTILFYIFNNNIEITKRRKKGKIMKPQQIVTKSTKDEQIKQCCVSQLLIPAQSMIKQQLKPHSI
jgi:hypothetical protein